MALGEYKRHFNVPTEPFIRLRRKSCHLNERLPDREIGRLVQWFLMLMIVAVVPACSGKKRVDWKEEVLLTAGSVIVIERSQEYRRVSEPGAGTGWLFESAGLRARMRQGDEDIIWDGFVQPLVLDTDKAGQLHLLATVETRQGRQTYSVPGHTSYVAFKYVDKHWSRITLDEFPQDLRPNLLASTWKLFIEQQEPSGTFVRLPAKRLLYDSPTLPDHYKRLSQLK